jgi:hypothetical protein
VSSYLLKRVTRQSERIGQAEADYQTDKTLDRAAA